MSASAWDGAPLMTGCSLESILLCTICGVPGSSQHSLLPNSCLGLALARAMVLPVSWTQGDVGSSPASAVHLWWDLTLVSQRLHEEIGPCWSLREWVRPGRVRGASSEGGRDMVRGRKTDLLIYHFAW